MHQEIEELTPEQRLDRIEAALGIATRVAGGAINSHEERIKALETAGILAALTDMFLCVSVLILIRQVGKVEINATVS